MEATAPAAAVTSSADRAQELDRVRVVACAMVTVVHAVWLPGSHVYGQLATGTRQLASLYLWITAFCVPAFLVVAFFLMERSLAEGGRGRRPVLWRRCDRLLPAYLFWTAAYGLPKLATGAVPLTPAAVADMLLIGGAAAHLYFIPGLLLFTLVAPALHWISRRTWLAVAVGASVPLATAWFTARYGPWSPAADWVLGLAGNLCFPLAGLVLARLWRTGAPAASWRAPLVGACVAVVVLAVAVMEHLATSEALTLRSALPTLAGRLVIVAYGVAVPCLLFLLPVRASWASALAPLTFGVYLAHPVFVKALQAAEEVLLGPATAWHGPLMIPNGLAAFALSAALAAWARRYPALRRVMA